MILGDEPSVAWLENVRIRLTPREGVDLYPVQAMELALYPGDRAAIVGESGCGKSMTARLLAGLLPRSASVSAENARLFADIDLTKPFPTSARGKRVAMIFQDPVSVLDPLARVGTQIRRVLRAAGVPREDQRRQSFELLDSLHIPQPGVVYRRYPHELSGGMCQRVAIAMALASSPELLIADEPTTALDLTTQQQVLRLIREYLDRSGATLLLISHDLRVVADLVDKVTVMYAGQAVERGSIQKILESPAHPYSRDLVASSILRRGTPAASIPGVLPPIDAMREHCAYVARCSDSQAVCGTEPLPLEGRQEGYVRCWFPTDRADVASGSGSGAVESTQGQT